MTDSGTWQSDIVVYLVPGYVVLLALVYACYPERLRVAKDKLGAGEVLASAVAALLIGIAVHQASTLALAVFQRVFDWPTFSGIASSFGHSEVACQKIATKLGVTPFDPGDCYLYARAYVASEAPAVAEANERLLRLANVCQNVVISILIAAVLIILPPREQSANMLRTVVVGSLAALFVGVFGYGMLNYWTGAVFRTFRAALLLL